jgi:tripartite-type tricarboxylate transporter receptor subunit TctC
LKKFLVICPVLSSGISRVLIRSLASVRNHWPRFFFGHLNNAKLRLLAVASPNRLPALPDVPTIAETLPGFEAVAWYGIVAPPKTPKDIVNTINADVNEALRQPELQDHLKKLSAEIFGGSVEKTSQYMREEVDRWRAVIKAANIEIQ